MYISEFQTYCIRIRVHNKYKQIFSRDWIVNSEILIEFCVLNFNQKPTREKVKVYFVWTRKCLYIRRVIDHNQKYLFIMYNDENNRNAKNSFRCEQICELNLNLLFYDTKWWDEQVVRLVVSYTAVNNSCSATLNRKILRDTTNCTRHPDTWVNNAHVPAISRVPLSFKSEMG